MPTAKAAAVGIRTDGPAVPPRLAGLVPLCDGCAAADAELHCGCCGQQQCRVCWADGENAFCGVCDGRAWHDVPPEASAVPAGLLRDDEDITVTGNPLAPTAFWSL